MRAVPRLLLGLLFSVSGTLAFAQTPSAAPTGEGRAGTFKTVEGDIRVGEAGAQRAAAPGEGLQPGERVRTGAKSAASITMRDGTVLVLGPGTTVDLSRFQYDATTQKGNFALDLLEGSVRVITGLLGKINPDLFKVTTPTSVVGVRGTDFIVEANPPAQVPERRLTHGPFTRPGA